MELMSLFVAILFLPLAHYLIKYRFKQFHKPPFMIITLLRYLISLTVGLILGYLIFSTSSQSPDPKETSKPEQVKSDLTVRNQAKSSKALDKTNALPPAQNATGNEDLVESLNQQLAMQAEKINELENELKQLKSAANSQTEEAKKLQTITMAEFEEQMKSQFMNRFSGVAIKVDGKQLEGIKKDFTRNQKKAEWNATYENEITNFIQQADANGFHFVDELSCNQRMCRLQVNSSDPENWQQLYHNMMSQEWYTSMTLTESSDVPGRHIYYITEPSPLDRR